MISNKIFLTVIVVCLAMQKFEVFAFDENDPLAPKSVVIHQENNNKYEEDEDKDDTKEDLNRDLLLSIDQNLKEHSSNIDSEKQTKDYFLMSGDNTHYILSDHLNQNLLNNNQVREQKSDNHKSQLQEKLSAKSQIDEEKIKLSSKNSLIGNENNEDAEKKQNIAVVPDLIRSRDLSNLNTNSEIIIHPGATEIVPISQGFINRIVTPFSHPEVISSSLEASSADDCSNFCIKGGVVYVNATSSTPLSMFIAEGDNPELAFAVTLVPKLIPSREIIFRIEGSDYRIITKPSDNSQPYSNLASEYEASIRDILRSLALGEIPDGYSMREASLHEYLPLCFQDGLSFSFDNPGLRFEGPRFTVYVGVVTNTSDKNIEAQESSCLGFGAVAASFWPHDLLIPNEKSEIFVVEKVRHADQSRKSRPSLIGR